MIEIEDETYGDIGFACTTLHEDEIEREFIWQQLYAQMLGWA
jgi:hypothetical protein